MDINKLFSELAQYNSIITEATEAAEALKDEIKAYMTANNLDTVNGNEHKATYKLITSSRLDTTALKKDLPEVAQQYTRTTENRRFTFS